MTQSLFNGLLIFGIVQACLFVGLLISKRKRITADWVLSACLFLFAVHSLLILVIQNAGLHTAMHVLPVNLTLLYGPFLLLYIHVLCPHTIVSKRKFFWHFLPFPIFLTLTLCLSDKQLFVQALALSGAFSGLLYCLLALSKLKRHKNYIVHSFSSTKGLSLNWISMLVKGIVTIWLVVLLLVVASRIFQTAIPLHWFFIAIPTFITYIGYNGLKQQIAWSAHAVEYPFESGVEHISSNEEQLLNRENEGYKKSGLQKQDLENIYALLERAMNNDKLFLEPNLSLQALAVQINTPQHHITQTLNRYARQNFYDYVNTYRVNLFIEKLKSDCSNNYSLLGIALDCGFNSKSSFNRIFKKTTGHSPSAYKKKLC